MTLKSIPGRGTKESTKAVRQEPGWWEDGWGGLCGWSWVSEEASARPLALARALGFALRWWKATGGAGAQSSAN